jgi:hypothetical protein
MKKIIVVLTLLAILALPVLALAQPSGTIGSLSDLADKIKVALWTVFGIIALICFVIAGVLFMTAAGNPEKVAAARHAFLWGVAGVVVGILAYSIVSIVESEL